MMNTPCGKTQYTDKKAALSAINFRQRRNNGQRSRRGKVKSLRAYCCPQCQAWHITRGHSNSLRHNRSFILHHD